MSPATAIHNTRQVLDGLDAGAPLEAPHRPSSQGYAVAGRMRLLGTSALQISSARRKGRHILWYTCRGASKGPP